MLNLQEYFTLDQNESILSFTSGDSLHIRYLILYTSSYTLKIITEEKYTLCRITHTIPWFKKENIAQMRYQSDQSKIHILSKSGFYFMANIQIMIQKEFISNWTQNLGLFSLEKVFDQKICKVIQCVQINEKMVQNRDNYSNIMQLGQPPQPQNQSKLKNMFNQFMDFQIWNNQISILLTKQGDLFFYDLKKNIIHLIYQLHVSIIDNQMIKYKKSEVLSLKTELNDIIFINLSFQNQSNKETKDSIIDNYENSRFIPQTQRFNDQNLSVQDVFFTENQKGQKIIFILEEYKNKYFIRLQCLSQRILFKYKPQKLSVPKKIYYMLPDDLKYQILDIIEIEKVLILLVFEQNIFKIVVLSKYIMQQKRGLYQKYFVFATTFQNLSLIDENLQQMEDNLQKIFNLDRINSAIMQDFEMLPGDAVLRLSPFKYHFQVKLQKNQLKEQLYESSHFGQAVELIDSEKSIINKNIVSKSALLITSQMIYLIHLNLKFILDESNPHIINGLLELSKQSNCLQTFHKSDYQIMDDVLNQNKIFEDNWINQILSLFWCKINCEQGVDSYLRRKDEIDQKFRIWIEKLQKPKELSLYEKFQIQLTPASIKLDTQFQKLMALVILLNLNFLPNQQIIEYICSQLFINSYNNVQNWSEEIISYQTQIIGQIFQKRRNKIDQQEKVQTKNQCININHWKNKQQFLCICLSILEIYLQYLINTYRVVISEKQTNNVWTINKQQALIYSNAVPLKQRLLLVLIDDSNEDQLKLFMSLLNQLVSDKDYINESRKLLLFMVFYKKILSKSKKCFSSNMLFFILCQEQQIDTIFMSNIIGLMEYQNVKKKKTNLYLKVIQRLNDVQRENFYEILTNKLKQQLIKIDKSDFDEIGLLQICLVLQVTNKKSIVTQFRNYLGKQNQWQFDIFCQVTNNN